MAHPLCRLIGRTLASLSHLHINRAPSLLYTLTFHLHTLPPSTFTGCHHGRVLIFISPMTLALLVFALDAFLASRPLFPPRRHVVWHRRPALCAVRRPKPFWAFLLLVLISASHLDCRLPPMPKKPTFFLYNAYSLFGGIRPASLLTPFIIFPSFVRDVNSVSVWRILGIGRIAYLSWPIIKMLQISTASIRGYRKAYFPLYRLSRTSPSAGWTFRWPDRTDCQRNYGETYRKLIIRAIGCRPDSAAVRSWFINGMIQVAINGDNEDKLEMRLWWNGLIETSCRGKRKKSPV